VFEAQCTAHDFVFGLRRLFNPAVKSRNAADYLFIRNAEQVNYGELPLERLGVYAEDDFTLVIELEYPKQDFPVLLTMPPMFPCNEAFYELAAGRYGLVDHAVAANGAFFLREWVYDPWWTEENRIILRRHNLNTFGEKVYPFGVNFLLDRGEHFGNFTSGNSDCIVVSGDNVNALIRRNYPYKGTEISTWGIKFGDKGAFSDRDLRLATAYATDTSVLDFTLRGYRKADGIIPDGIKHSGEFYRDLAGKANILSADADKAVIHFNNAQYLVNAMTEFPVLIMPHIVGDTAIDTYVRTIVQQWQEKLSLFCRIEVLSSHEYAVRLQDGNYDIAVVKLTAAFNSPYAVLEILESLHGEHYGVDSAVIENALLESAAYIPICFMTEYFFRHKRSDDIVYNPFSGTISFREAKFW
jgi:oligopeptide transport system substrate-binding protein